MLCSRNKVLGLSCMSAQLVLEVAIDVGPLLGLKNGDHLPAHPSSGRLSLWGQSRYAHMIARAWGDKLSLGSSRRLAPIVIIVYAL